MADEKKDSSAKESEVEAGAAAPKAKSDMMMYIIVAVGALVVTMSVMLGLMSGEPTHSADAEGVEDEHAEVADHSSDELEDQETPDIFSELDDLSFLGDTLFPELVDSHESTDGHVSSKDKKSHSKKSKKSGKAKADSQGATSAEDSLAALSWIEAEKKKISNRSKALDEKAKRLEALERSVNQKLIKVDQAEAARLTGLAKLYNGMKADQVVRMMVKLDDKMIVAILPRMKSAQASKILGLLPASRGAKISQAMITLSNK